MRVALVHDYLNQFGGAERVLETLSEIFPEAPIYTLFYDKEGINGRFANKDIKTSFLDKPLIRKRHRWFIPLFAKAVETLDLGDNYDLIISDSYGFAKGIKYGRGFHISYIHTPLRYAWEPEFFLHTLFSKTFIKLASPVVNYLRVWDKKTSERPNLLLTNSTHTAGKIKKFYDRESTLLYPPVDAKTFYPDKSVKTKNYYLAFGRIVHFKRFDLIVKVFNELGLPLKIAGVGPEKENIKKLIKSPNIEFINRFHSEEELRKLICGAKAVIFPQVEDFGLVAAESITCGTPVIAFSEGGVLEIVKDEINGILFNEQNHESLVQAIKKFEKTTFDKRKVARTSKIFSKESFEKNLRKTIDSIQPIILAREQSPALL